MLATLIEQKQNYQFAEIHYVITCVNTRERGKRETVVPKNPPAPNSTSPDTTAPRVIIRGIRGHADARRVILRGIRAQKCSPQGIPM